MVIRKDFTSCCAGRRTPGSAGHHIRTPGVAVIPNPRGTEGVGIPGVAGIPSPRGTERAGIPGVAWIPNPRRTGKARIPGVAGILNPRGAGFPTPGVRPRAQATCEVFLSYY